MLGNEETEKLLDTSDNEIYHSFDQIESPLGQIPQLEKSEKGTYNAAQDDFSVGILGHGKGGSTTGVDHTAEHRSSTEPGSSQGCHQIEEDEEQQEHPQLQNQPNDGQDNLPINNTLINSISICVFLVVISLLFILSFSIVKAEVAINYTVGSVINGTLSVLDILAILFMLTQMFICRNNFHESSPQSGLLMFLVLFIFVPMGLLFRLIEWVEAYKILACCSPVYIIRLSSDILFIVTASIFTRKLLQHRIRGCRSKIVFTKAAIVMLTVACSCQWLHQLKTEKDHELAANRTRPAVCKGKGNCQGDDYCQSLTDMKYTLEPYIGPFIVEFAISVVGLMYLPYKNAGNNEIGYAEDREFRHFLPVRPISFIIGMIVFVSCLLTLVFLGTYNVTEKEKLYGLFIYNYQILMVFAVANFVNILLFRVVWQMEVIPCESIADRFVLWITMFGQLLVSVSMFTAAAIQFGKENSPEYKQYLGVTMLTYGIITIQYTFQTVTLDICLSRRLVPTNRNYPKTSALQPSFILLLLNLGMWLVNLYTREMQDTHSIAKHIFEDNFWPIVDSISYPLSIMQRLHSAVLYYDILLKTS